MMDFRNITHVIRNPAGTFSLVGSVPQSLCDATEATVADVMAGRVDPTSRMVYRPRVYQTAGDAFAAVDAAGTGCQLPSCACAALRQS